MANYPTALPSTTPATHGVQNDEVVAIATELGTIPKGFFGSVRARLDADIADEASLRKLVDLAASDRHRSALTLRKDRDDQVSFIEPWANLTSWNPSANNQVSAGKVYGLATAQNPAGGARTFAVPRFGRFRMTATVNFVTGGTDYAMFGLNTAAPPLAAGAGTGGLMWGLLGTQPSRFNSGGATGYASGNMYSVGSSAASTATATYRISVQGDETGISASVIDTAHGVEWTDYIPWSSIPTAFASASFWMQDTRALTGTNITALGASNTINTTVPRTNIEGIQNADWVNTALSNGNSVRICLPASYDSRIPTPVVMYHHGRGEDATGPFTEVVKRSWIQAMVNAGYIVASSDANLNNWGNNAGISAYVDVYRYLRDHFSIGPIHHLGQSMGGLTSTLTIAARAVPAASLSLVYPITNLADAYANASFTAEINTAYNIPTGGTYAAQTAGHDPALMRGYAFRGLPVWGIASAGDLVVNKANNLDAFITAVTPYASEVTTLVSTGTHGDPSNFNATSQTSILAFLARHSLATAG